LRGGIILERLKLERFYACVGELDRIGNRVVKDKETNLSFHIGPDGKALYERRFRFATNFERYISVPHTPFRALVETIDGERLYIDLKGHRITR